MRDRDGKPVDGLHQVWISLDNEAQLNSYTTAAVKDVILALPPRERRSPLRRASSSPAPATRRSAPAATPPSTRRTTRAGRSSTCSTCGSSTTWSRASCSATSRSSAASTACASAAGRRSAWPATSPSPATTRASARPARCTARRPTAARPTSSHLFVGVAHAAESLVLCEPWCAHKALRLGLAQRGRAGAQDADGQVRRRTRSSSPTATPTRCGRIVLRRVEDGRRAEAAKARGRGAARSTCRASTRRSSGSRRSCSTRSPTARARRSRACARRSSSTGTRTARRAAAWLALNMTTEAAAGFAAFHYGDKNEREIDFVAAAPAPRRGRALRRRRSSRRCFRRRRARAARRATEPWRDASSADAARRRGACCGSARSAEGRTSSRWR